MYCVKCGVRLQDGAGECPLCGTPVPVERMPDETVKATYSDRYPHEKQVGKFLLLGMVTVMMAVAALACFILCMKLKGEVAWSGYVMLGLALAYVIFVLPAWFSRWMPLIFIPVDFAAICGYLLYICLYEHQHWFLSFAFPVTMIVGAYVVTAAALFSSIKGGRFYILSGLCIAFGALCMLVEFFQHITFGTEMFLWSLYCVCFFGAVGLFLLTAAIIRPLREFLERKFFF